MRLPVGPVAAECGILAATSAYVVAKLLASEPLGLRGPALALAVALTATVELFGREPRTAPRQHIRPCAQQGSRLAHVLLPLLMVVLLLQHAQQFPGSSAVQRMTSLQFAVACAAPAVGRLQHGPGQATSKAGMLGRVLVMAVLPFAGPVSIAGAAGLHWTVALALALSGTVPALHSAVLWSFPLTFTWGEAWICATGAFLTLLWLMGHAASDMTALGSVQGAVRLLLARPDLLVAVICLASVSACIALASPVAHGLRSGSTLDLPKRKAASVEGYSSTARSGQKQPAAADQVACGEGGCASCSVHGTAVSGPSARAEITPTGRTLGLPWLAAARAAALAVAHAIVLGTAAWATVTCVLARPVRLLTLLLWLVALASALPAMAWLQRRRALPHVVLRKGFHLLAFVMFAPALVADEVFLAVALAVAFAGMVCVELIRALKIRHVSATLTTFMSRFTDSRDSGALLISHISLLLGIAVPIWLNVGRAGIPARQQLAAWSGIVSLGIADSAAAAVGTAFGTVKVHTSTRKTVEGTLAATAAMTVTMALLIELGIAGEKMPSRTHLWLSLGWRCLLTCFLEAATTQLDNIVFPMHAYVMFAAQ